MKYVSYLALCFHSALVFLSIYGDARGSLIFDNFNGPREGGSTSANGGVGEEIVTDRDITLTNISAYNRMTESGQIIFLIWNAADHTKLFQTSAMQFGPDAGTAYTWKMSTDFTFTLHTGVHYVIGSNVDVSHDDAYDSVPESQNGITSEMVLWSVSGFPATSVRPFIGGADSAIRLYGVPEPSTLILAALGGLTLLAMRRKRTSP